MAKALAESFNRSQVSSKIYAFNDKCYVAKDYHQRQVAWETLWADGDTDMALAMKKSRSSLMTRNADRKIMIVLSDGDAGYDAMEEAFVARQNRMEVYGFFIGCDAPHETVRSFTGVFGNLSPEACVSEVCGAVQRTFANNQNR